MSFGRQLLAIMMTMIIRYLPLLFTSPFLLVLTFMKRRGHELTLKTWVICLLPYGNLI